MSWGYALHECHCFLQWPKKCRPEIKMTKCPLKKRKRKARGECFWVNDKIKRCPALGSVDVTDDLHASGAVQLIFQHITAQMQQCDACTKATEARLRKKLKGAVKKGGK